MSSAEVDACVEILEDHFGGLVASVGRVLLGGEATLPIIALRLRKLNVGLVKRSLMILEQHNIVTFRIDDRRIVYSIKPEDVQRLARSARCSFLVKTLYGEVAEAICEELVCHGRLSCSECLRRVSSRLDTPLSEVKTKFARLAETQLVIRCPLVEAEDYDCPVFEKQTDPFIMPDLILSAVKQNTANHDSSSTTRKRKHEGGGSGDVDADILWRLNHPRFERYMRDEMVVDAVSKIDSFGAECVKTIRTLLKISELKADSRAAASLPISVQDVIRAANANEIGLEKNDIEVALRIMSDDSDQIVRRIGDSAGGLYVVDFEKAISVQCQSNIESIIREKFDSVAVRIFRLLLQKGHLEEEQIEKLAMLSSKESKELCYTLLDEHFISVRHVAKTNDFAPARTFCLYHVDLSDLAQLLYDNICKTLRNVIVRRRHETKEHRMLIERQLKMESIIANIEADTSLDEESKKQQISEVEDMYLTAADRSTLERYRHGQNDLLCHEMELNHDALLFSLFIDFAKRRL
uniref:DNA-directed RNA polymerase III subunit RPC3 n=2 Tax=Parascaris univalens TaxID=6257 RepID=A0A915CJE7_PARUN